MMRARTKHKPSSADRPNHGSELAPALVALSDAVADHTLLREHAASLRERLEHQRFQLAVLGQFKRGKSTFINALLGAALLPAAVVPLTAVPVFISWGPSPLARVRFGDQRVDEELSTDNTDTICKFLFEHISEEANPNNRLGVDRVDLYCPSLILADGIVLIDTPGVGSTFRHNTEAALRVLSESDAALFVISVDPPITEVEIDYLKQIKKTASKLVFVLNKIDYQGADDRRHIKDFVRRTLERNKLWTTATALFGVSATDGLDAKQRGDAVKLQSSGIADVERYLSHDLAAQKERLLEQAVRTKAAHIASEAIAETRLAIRAMEMPLDDLASKCRKFAQVLASIEGQRRTIRDLLEGERRRLRDKLEELIQRLRVSARAEMTACMDRQLPNGDDPGELGRMLAEIFDRARQDLSSAFVAAVDTALLDHRKRIGLLIDEVRQTAGKLFDAPFRPDFEAESFSLGEDPYWVTERIQTSLFPDASGFVDRLLPLQVRSRRRRARVLLQIDELILRNAENLRWALLRGVDETFRKASAQFEMHLDHAITTTNGIVRDAFGRRQRDQLAIGNDLSAFRKKEDLLRELQAQFGAESRGRETEELE